MFSLFWKVWRHIFPLCRPHTCRCSQLLWTDQIYFWQVNLSQKYLLKSTSYKYLIEVPPKSTPVVVLNTYELIKSTFERKKDNTQQHLKTEDMLTIKMFRAEYSGRPGNFSGTFFQKGKTGDSGDDDSGKRTLQCFELQELQQLMENTGETRGTSCQTT